MNTAVAAVILAAGKGSRMGSPRHKVLHELQGRPMLDHLLSSLSEIGAERTVLVVGAAREQIETAYPGIPMAIQHEQLGTGHAVRAAEPLLRGFSGTVLVLYGDVPLVSASTMRALCVALSDGTGLAVLGFRPADRRAYGRLVTDDKGELLRIMEHSDTNEAERAIGFCNSGIMAAGADLLFRMLPRIGCDNAKGEYYLTDIVALARGEGHHMATVEAPELEVAGVNSREELAALEAELAEAPARGPLWQRQS